MELCYDQAKVNQHVRSKEQTLALDQYINKSTLNRCEGLKEKALRKKQELLHPIFKECIAFETARNSVEINN